MVLSLGMSFEYKLVGKKATEIILTAVETEDIGKKMMRSRFHHTRLLLYSLYNYTITVKHWIIIAIIQSHSL